MAIFPGSAIPSAVSGYDIDNSCRFNVGDPAYLSRTPGSTGNRQIWTFSAWVKRGTLTTGQNLFHAGTGLSGNSGYFGVYFGSDDKLRMTTGSTPLLYTDALYRDPSAWYHVVAVDDSGTFHFYVNGVEPSYSTNTGLGGTDTAINNTVITHVGIRSYVSGGTTYTDASLNGYLAEVYFIDGQALDGDDFGELDSDTNQWIPKDASGLTFGTNGFYLKFQDSAALGDDSSGNTNDFTPTNLAATDQMIDTPTNNFATLNPLVRPHGTNTFAEGNLKVTSDSNWNTILGTQSMSSGKWYWEARVGSTNFKTGVMPDDVPASTSGPHASYGILYLADGTKQIDGTATSYGATFAADDIIGYAVDMDASTIIFYKNNASQGSISFSGTVANAASAIPGGASYSDTSWFNFGSDSSFAGEETAQGNQDGNGKGDFYYAPPTDYLALCADNLSDPEIALPGENFETVLFTGTGATRTVATSFQSDFAWFKQRDAATGHLLYNTITGGTNSLVSNTTAAEAQHGDAVLTFNSANIQIAGTDTGGLNGDANSMVLWNWKAGGAAVTNTDGTNIDSQVSANTTAGFSICTYTGTANVGDSFGHGLGVKPNLIIVKKRAGGGGAGSWYVYNSISDVTNYLVLNTTAALDNGATGFFNDTEPTTSIVTLGDSHWVNGSTETYVAYCFASIEGYSKVGSYVGNGNVDGAFIYIGFSPKFILFKKASSSGDVRNWVIKGYYPDYNNKEQQLRPNETGAEGTSDYDFLSNGAKVRKGAGESNDDGATYMYYAIAESPFKTSNAR